MATLIICPACETRYETAAVFPPEGRKVRCSKCGNVWQAKAVVQPEAVATGLKVAAKAPGPATPLQAPAAKPKPKPKPATVNTGIGGFAGMAAPKATPSLAEKMAAATVAEVPPDADFSADEDLAAQVERMNAEAAMAAEGVLPDEKPSSGGIFARLRAKKPPAPAKPPELSQEPALPEMPPSEPAFASVPPEEAELAALAAGEVPPAEAPSRVVAMGWLALILFVALILGLLFFAKGTVLSVLPGAQRLYGMFGGGSAASGLTFEGVRYGWSNEGGQAVLEVQGDVVNSTSSPVAVPQVVIALRDEKGNEISEWTTDTGADELAAGEHAAFLRQIPSPPSNVRNVKVRFAKAN
jgi:predicted Zn finger-like uncharacterized protein